MSQDLKQRIEALVAERDDLVLFIKAIISKVRYDVKRQEAEGVVRPVDRRMLDILNKKEQVLDAVRGTAQEDINRLEKVIKWQNGKLEKLIVLVKKLIVCAEIQDKSLHHEYQTGEGWDSPVEISEAKATLKELGY